jgi:hypothetical protein
MQLSKRRILSVRQRRQRFVEFDRFGLIGDENANHDRMDEMIGEAVARGAFVAWSEWTA